MTDSSKQNRKSGEISCLKVCITVLVLLVISERIYSAYAVRHEAKYFTDYLFAAEQFSPLLQHIEQMFVKLEKTLMVLATIAVAYFTWTLYRTAIGQLTATQNALKISESTLFASQRPWLKVVAGFSGPLTIDTDERVNVEIVVNVKNIGKSPAMNVRINPHLVPTIFRTGVAPHEKLTQLCKTERERPLSDESVLGFTVFPEEEITERMRLNIALTEILMPSDEGVPPTHFSFHLVGFVSYRTTLDTKLHLTQFMGDFNKHDKTRPGMHLCFSVSDRYLPNEEYGMWLSPFIGARAD